jgi:hypothetical protein
MYLFRRFVLLALLSPGLASVAQAVPLARVPIMPIAEIHPVWSALASCLLAAALILRHSAKFRK